MTGSSMHFRLFMLTFIAASSGCSLLNTPTTSTTQQLPRATANVNLVSRRWVDISDAGVKVPVIADSQSLPLPKSGAPVGDVLANALSRHPLRTFTSADYHQCMVRVDKSIGQVYFPVSLMERHELRDYFVAPGAIVEIVDENTRNLFNVNSQGVPITTSNSAAITVAGMVNRSGVMTFNQDNGLAVNLERVSFELQIDGTADSGPDIVIVRRLRNNLPQEFIVPVSRNSKYKRDAHDIYLAIERAFVLQDGDVLEYSRMDLLPNVIAGKVQRSVEKRLAERRSQNAASTAQTARRPAFGFSLFR